jgi:GntP family gluconate:H+ symporter
VLQNSGIVDLIGGAMVGGSLGLWLPFLIAAALRTAQGSATVALITTASLLAPLSGPLGLAAPAGKALMVLAIGAGAMVASHANDSMFWIVTQMSGMDVKTGYRLQTVLTTALGFSAAFLLWLVGLVLL